MNKMSFQDILVDEINISKVVRTRTIEDDVDELKRSIQQSGFLCPIVVFPVNDGYELIAGTKRLLACMQLDWETIAAMIMSPPAYAYGD